MGRSGSGIDNRRIVSSSIIENECADREAWAHPAAWRWRLVGRPARDEPVPSKFPPLNNVIFTSTKATCHNVTYILRYILQKQCE